MSVLAALSAKSALFVAAGAAVGGLLRYAAGALLPATSPVLLSTLFVNVAGGFCIGFAAGYLSKSPSDWLQFFVMMGVLGGFTTFSAFSLESLRLLQNQAYAGFILHAGLHFILSLVACAIGLWFALQSQA